MPERDGKIRSERESALGYAGKASAVVSVENEIMNVRLATTAPQTPT